MRASFAVDEGEACAVYFNSCFQKPREAVAGGNAKAEESSSSKAGVLA